MPYRVDLRGAGEGAFERLVDLGAFDVEPLQDDGLAAVMPDAVSPEEVARALGVSDVSVSPAVSRDAGSVWVLHARPVHVGGLRILPVQMPPEPGALRLVDGAAFGTGLHPTTILCLEALQDIVRISRPDHVLDVGTGSGILALAALWLGVPQAFGVDIDDEALRAAAENARLNGVAARLQLARGGPEAITGTFPLVLANVLAAPLVEMAPALVRRLGHRGRLVLSGIPAAVQPDVGHAYRRLGVHVLQAKQRNGWAALVLQASW